ncbi:phage tail assembly protein T [Suttonella ornithocola]|uniref:phage tail assembly protein T n=1 Tax=Suttonella ornithocola TaxID=279832 RepID=UPI003CCC6666
MAEVCQNLSANEYMIWRRYRAKYGSLNAANRQEWMLAQLTAVVAATNGADVDIYDFSPSFERPRVEFLDVIGLNK